MTITPDNLTLSAGQEAALLAFQQFLCDPEAKYFVLSGYAGTGKSTLVKTILANLDTYLACARLLNDQVQEEYILTATTNKAAEALAQITGKEVKTIHSALRLTLNFDYEAGKNVLSDDSVQAIYNKIVFIDEASYVSGQLMGYVDDNTMNCKIVYMGDKAQLTDVMTFDAPVFKAGFNEAGLTEVVRQAAGNPIIEIATSLREWVNTGIAPKIRLDHNHVRHVDRATFDNEIVTEFSRRDWRYASSKVLAWTNKTVIEYNKFVREHAKGDPDFQVGDYATVNNYTKAGRISFKTDAMVHINDIGEPQYRDDVRGRFFTINGTPVFVPFSLADWNARIKRAKAEKDYEKVKYLSESWADLRAVYAQTVNKSQGSTYDKVFIDLDDISRCRQTKVLARMLYVAVSRARHNVILTGDLSR